MKTFESDELRGPSVDHSDKPTEAVSLALLNPAGVIVAANQAWEDFARDNGGHPARTGIGVNYLDACVEAGDDPLAPQVAEAVRSAIQGALPAPVLVRIPGHDLDEDRWFDELISSRFTDTGDCVGATITLSPSARVPVKPYRTNDVMLEHAVSRLEDAHSLLDGLAQRLVTPVDRLTLTATFENLDAVIRDLRPRHQWRHR